MAKKLEKVRSLPHLHALAGKDDRYKELLFAAAENLGGEYGDRDIDKAYRWLITNAMETSEDGVIEEVNFLRSHF